MSAGHLEELPRVLTPRLPRPPAREAGLSVNPPAQPSTSASLGNGSEPQERPVSDGVDLPEGVLHPAGRDLSLLVAIVGLAAAAEAGWNVGRAALVLLKLPLPLAVMFPLVLEAAALSCALQDLRDRRQGVRSRALEVGTYLGLVASAAVNGTVGWVGHGPPGLLEVLPPLVLAGLIHVHGHRATRAYRSRAVLRPAWRAEQLRTAQVESVAEVLPLLTGTDVHGRSTVDLLRRRLDSATLSPAGALLAAGWHKRHDRSLSDSELRRLEIVAATVWSEGAPPELPTHQTDQTAAHRLWNSVSRTSPVSSGSGQAGPVRSEVDRAGAVVGEQAGPVRSEVDRAGAVVGEQAGPVRSELTDAEAVSVIQDMDRHSKTGPVSRRAIQAALECGATRAKRLAALARDQV